MKRETSVNRAISVISIFLMSCMSLMQLITGIYILQATDSIKIKIIPSFLRNLISVDSDIKQYFMILNVFIFAVAIFLIVSAILTYCFIRKNSCNRKFIFQKISCISAFVLFIITALLIFMNFSKYSFWNILLYLLFCCGLYMFYAILIAIVFVISSKDL